MEPFYQRRIKLAEEILKSEVIAIKDLVSHKVKKQAVGDKVEKLANGLKDV